MRRSYSSTRRTVTGVIKEGFLSKLSVGNEPLMMTVIDCWSFIRLTENYLLTRSLDYKSYDLVSLLITVV